MEPSKPKSLTIHYGGPTGLISAKTLGMSLIGFAQVLDGISNSLVTDRPVHVEVIATASGSFEVVLQVFEGIAATSPTLFNHVAVTAMDKIIKATALALHLRSVHGKSPIKTQIRGNKVTVLGAGTVNVYEKAYFMAATEQKYVAPGLDQFYGALSVNPSVENIKLIEDEAVIFETDRNGIKRSLEGDTDDPEHPDKDVVVQAKLTIVKPSYDPSLKWAFMMHGERIEAMVLDKVTNDNVDNRVPYLKGDILVATVTKRQKWIASFGAYATKEYIVTHVNGHRKPKEPKQIEIKFSAVVPKQKIKKSKQGHIG